MGKDFSKYVKPWDLFELEWRRAIAQIDPTIFDAAAEDDGPYELGDKEFENILDELEK